MWMNSRKNNNREKPSLAQSFDCGLFCAASSCLENLTKMLFRQASYNMLFLLSGTSV